MNGSELKALRQQAKLSGRDLASRLGLSAETVSRYENGHSAVPPSVALAVRYISSRENDNGQA